MSLKELIRSKVADRDVSVLVAEAVLEPPLGPSDPISPPTYARAQGDSSKDPNFALSPKGFVPEPLRDGASAGWHMAIARDEQGRPRQELRVVVDSIGSQASRSESALWQHQNRLGVALPGLVLRGPGPDRLKEPLAALPDALRKKVTNDLMPQVDAALTFEVSSWEAPHRHVDAWFRFADSEKHQVWKGGHVKDLITGARPQPANVLYENFPNACAYGYWLSSGVAQRHRLPRAYSSAITGYGAQGVSSGATKLDAAGGTSKTSKLSLGASGLSAGTGTKPSDYGFGQVPTHPAVRAFVCDKILQQSSLSLPVLRSLRFEDDRDGSRSVAAMVVLTLLAMAGRALSNEDGFLRSGCSLVVVSDRWGWRRRGAPDAEPIEPMPVVSVDELAAALREAVSDAEAVGLRFQPPIELQPSEPQVQLIVDRVIAEAATLAEDQAS